MLLLQSQDKFDELVELNTTTGQVEWYSKHANPLMCVRPIQGHFSQFGEQMVFFYREGGTLHLRVDDADVELDDNTQIALDQHTNFSVLKVMRFGKVIYEWRYTSPVIYPPLEADPTPFVEEEQFDFGQFVYNVMHTTHRRNTIYHD
jgi:hypothetical protein